MNRAYKFRIYPNKEQENLLSKTFGCCRFLYNVMLSDKKKAYQETGKMLKNTPAMYKKEYPFLKEVDSLALANVQLHLEQAYRNFFRNPSTGFPKFKSKQLYHKCGKRKHRSGRGDPETAQAGKGQDKTAPGDSGRIPVKVRDGQQGAIGQVLCQSFI